MFAGELAKMEVKFKEQLKTNESLKLQLAAEEDRYKVCIARGQTQSATQGISDILPSSKEFCLLTLLCFTAMFGCSSSRIENLMLSFSLNTVTPTGLFMSQPISEMTF